MSLYRWDYRARSRRTRDYTGEDLPPCKMSADIEHGKRLIAYRHRTCLLLRHPNRVEHERVPERPFAQHVITSGRTSVPARHVDLDVKRIGIGLHRTQLRHPLRRLPVH